MSWKINVAAGAAIAALSVFSISQQQKNTVLQQNNKDLQLTTEHTVKEAKDKAETSLADLQEEITKLRSKAGIVPGLKGKIEKLEGERTDLGKTIQELEVKLQVLEKQGEEIAALKGELAERQTALDKLVAEQTVLTEQAETADASVDGLEAQVAEGQATINKQQKMLAEKLYVLKRMKFSLEGAAEEIDLLSRELEKSRLNTILILDFLGNKNEEVDVLGMQIENLTTVLKKKGSEVSDLQIQKQQAVADLQTFEEKVASGSVPLPGIERIKLNEVIQKLNGALEQKNQEVAEVVSSLGQLEGEKNSLGLQLQETLAQNSAGDEQFKAEIAVHRTRIEELMQVIKGKDEVLSGFAEEIAKQQAASAAYQKTVEELQAAKNTLVAENETLGQQLQEATASNNDTESKQIELVAQTEKLAEENSQAVGQVEAMTAVIADLETKIAGFAPAVEELASVKEQLSLLGQELAAAKQSLADAQAISESLAEASAGETEELVKLKEQAVVSSEHIAVLEEKLATVEALATTVMEKSQIYEEVADASAKQLLEQQAAIAGYEETVKGLQVSLDGKSAELVALALEQEALAVELAAAKQDEGSEGDKLTEAKGQITVLEAEVEALKAELDQLLRKTTDSDADGVVDADDLCLNTVKGADVDASGCEIDDDSDGLVNRLDLCAGSNAGSEIDAMGCSADQETTVVKGVSFKLGTARLTVDAQKALDRVAAILIANPAVKMEVGGHTDSVGVPERNLMLSSDRAKSVLAYLVAKGVGEERLRARGYGQDNPVADNATNGGRAQNRRVELKRFTDEPAPAAAAVVEPAPVPVVDPVPVSVDDSEVQGSDSENTEIEVPEPSPAQSLGEDVSF